MNFNQVLNVLKENANPENVKGMSRFGINQEGTLGISIPFIRKLGKEIKKNKDINLHNLALELWESKIHEARILSSIIESPENISLNQAQSWIKDFDSWDVCDQVCMNLLDRTEFAIDLASSLTKENEVFVKRAGFALMAALAFHRHDIEDKICLIFFEAILNECEDERNFVKKAVNWALRQIGKRNLNLNKIAINYCNMILSEKNHSS